MAGEEYPWLMIDLGRPHRVTTVWVVAGNQTITNLDVRLDLNLTALLMDGDEGTTLNIDGTR